MGVIHRKRDIWLYGAGFGLVGNCAVVPTVMFLDAPSEWPVTVPITFTLTLILAIVLTHLIARQTIQNFKLAEDLSRLLERDRLTDVATRDFFFKRMTEAPDAYGLSLMIDIDHFKSVNDTYGHLAGDAVIRHVAQILRRNCRQKDIVCRFGGEEFVVFLYGVGEENGFDTAERIRKIVEAAVTQHEDIDLKVTVSIGGSLKQGADQIDRAIKQADEALYRAKELGRNRSVMSWLRQDTPSKSAA